MKKIKFLGKEYYLLSREERDSLERTVKDLYGTGRHALNTHRNHIKIKDRNDVDYDMNLDEIMKDGITETEKDLDKSFEKAIHILLDWEA